MKKNYKILQEEIFSDLIFQLQKSELGKYISFSEIRELVLISHTLREDTIDYLIDVPGGKSCLKQCGIYEGPIFKERSYNGHCHYFINLKYGHINEKGKTKLPVHLYYKNKHKKFMRKKENQEILKRCLLNSSNFTQMIEFY